MGNMRIAGLEKCSFVDYPGCMSAVVFTPGCNLNCFYCHNRQLITSGDRGGENRLSVQTVLDFLARRQGMLDAVCVTGGEPTLQPDLPAFLAAVRAMGYRVKLDSNGTNPDVLAEVLDEHLVDFVAMDVKAPTDLYDRICQTHVDQKAISRSIALLLEGRVACEFRTTFAPPLTNEDILRIALRIRGARSYVLQQYRPQSESDAPAYNPMYIRSAAEALRPFVRHCSIRGADETVIATRMPSPEAANRLAATAPA